jgi:broad specificity phosphatase PhoE
MKKLYFLLLLVASLAARGQQLTTFVLVRHAEKVVDGSRDPDLTPEGKARALRLVTLLEKCEVSAIYSTNVKRTQQTAAPLAESKRLKVALYEPLNPAELDAMLRAHAGGTVVIAGHSNDIPWIANQLLGREAYQNFNDADYGNVLVVTVQEKGKLAKVTHLRY